MDTCLLEFTTGIAKFSKLVIMKQRKYYDAVVHVSYLRLSKPIEGYCCNSYSVKE